MVNPGLGKYLGRIISVSPDPMDPTFKVVFYYDAQDNVNRTVRFPVAMGPQGVKAAIKKLLLRGPPDPAVGGIYE